jgi:hypothetical protein
MSETIRKGDVVRLNSIGSPAIVVVECRPQPDESVLAEFIGLMPT